MATSKGITEIEKKSRKSYRHLKLQSKFVRLWARDPSLKNVLREPLPSFQNLDLKVENAFRRNEGKPPRLVVLQFMSGVGNGDSWAMHGR